MSKDYREKCLEEKSEECVLCGSSENIEVHHIDGDRSNDDIENLIPLCQSHHAQIHNGSSGSSYDGELPEVSPERPGYQKDVVPVRIPEWMIDHFDREAQETGSNRSQVIRDRLLKSLVYGFDK